MPRWMVMWGIALALYAACKGLTYRDVRRRRAAFGRGRLAGYLLAWPGMDAAAFLASAEPPPRPSAFEWVGAWTKTIGGVALFWCAAALAPHHPYPAGWLAMAGILFVLHFGVFHVLSCAWRHAGVKAQPIMRNPLRATSLADFWSRRWNTAFHDLAVRFAFTPLRPIIGVVPATVAVFLVSGLIHELVISVPAGGGYGLPTAYFGFQGLAAAAERTRTGRRFGLGRGWRGRLFTVGVTAGPAFLLFPPRFIHAVILPMIAAVTAARGFAMVPTDLPSMLRIAGVLHIGLMCAGVMMTRVVDMRAHLATLPPFLRQLFWVYYGFIGLCLAAFSTMTIAFADTLAGGGALARAVCGFLAVFWTLRLIAGAFVFDLRPYLTTGSRRFGYHALNVVFAYLPIVYAVAALRR